MRLLAPVKPACLYGAGLNHFSHARDMKLDTPAYPMLFTTPPSAIAGPEVPVVHPIEAQDLHFEAEVAAVTGKKGRCVPEARALGYVFGHACANDISERMIQAEGMRQGYLVLGKAFVRFKQIGPSIASAPDAGGVKIIRLQYRCGNVNDLVHSIKPLIAYLSSGIKLHPGHVTMMGTSASVGPGVPGDLVQIGIPQAGILRNPGDAGQV